MLLNANNTIRDEHISQLGNLRSLSLDSAGNISAALRNFPGLTFLDLQANRVVHDDILSRLTNLRTLSLMMNPTITDAGIATLTGLESLNIMLNEKITFPTLGNFKRLTHIKVAGSKITAGQVKDLPGGSKITVQ